MIKGQNIPQSNIPGVQKLDAKSYTTDLLRHEAAYNHNNIHAPGSDAETVVSVGALVLGAAEKTTPVNADMFPIMDTADSNKVRKLSWANIKATLKAYFDTLYAAASTVTFPGFGSTGLTACVGNDSRLSDSRTPVAHNHTAANVTDFASVALSYAPAETTTTIGALINGATAITVPDDTDTIAMRNHTGGLLHKMTWAFVKSVLKTYFDTLYIGSSSLSANGYQILPGGLIMQWGTAVTGTQSGSSPYYASTGTVTYPITFTTLYSITAVVSKGSPAAFAVLETSTWVDKFTAYAMSYTSGEVATKTISWIAFGK